MLFAGLSNNVLVLAGILRPQYPPQACLERLWIGI